MVSHLLKHRLASAMLTFAAIFAALSVHRSRDSMLGDSQAQLIAELKQKLEVAQARIDAHGDSVAGYRSVQTESTSQHESRSATKETPSTADTLWPPVAGVTEAMFKEYAQIHKKIMDPKDTTVKKRFIGIMAESQLDHVGNQMLPMISTLMLAILTKRAFVIDDKSAFLRYFDTPILGSVSVRSIPASKRNEKFVVPVGWRGMPLTKIEYSTFKDVETITCAGDFSKWHDDIRFIRILTTQYFGRFLVENPQLRGWFEHAFPDGAVFGPLFRLLFRPKPQVKLPLQLIYDSHFKNRHVVAIQVRFAKHGGNFVLRDDLPLFQSCARAMVLQKPKENVYYFLATDSSDVKKLFRTWFGDKLILFDDIQAQHSAQKVDGRIADIVLGAAANDWMVTGESTFGALIPALAAGGGRDVPRGPVLLDGRFLTCWRNLHSEPSCHVGEVALRASCKKNSSNNFNSPLNVNNVDTRGVNKCAAGGLKSMRGWLDWIPGQPSWFPPSCLKSVPILGEGR